MDVESIQFVIVCLPDTHHPQVRNGLFCFAKKDLGGDCLPTSMTYIDRSLPLMHPEHRNYDHRNRDNGGQKKPSRRHQGSVSGQMLLEC